MGRRSHRRGPEGSARHERRHDAGHDDQAAAGEAAQDRVKEHLADMMSSPGFDVAGDPDGVTFDFDKHWAAKRQQQQKPRIRVYGRVYAMPASLPAKVMFMSQSKEFRDKDRKVTQEEGYGTIRQMLDMALPEGAVDRMLDDGIEMDELPDLLAYVMGHYDQLGRKLFGDDEQAGGDDQGEASGGRRPATTGTGRGSSGS